MIGGKLAPEGFFKKIKHLTLETINNLKIFMIYRNLKYKKISRTNTRRNKQK